MEQNLNNCSETPSYSDLQNSPKVISWKNWLKISFVGLIGSVLLTGVFYAGSKITSKKESAKDNQPSPQITSNTSVTPIMAPPSTQEVIKPIDNQKTPVISPEKYGFTKTIELKGIGVKAKFPQNVSLSLQEEYFYVIKASEYDAVTFTLKNYDGEGRREWFQKEYPWAKNYVMEPFTGTGHSGYIAYAVKLEDRPGSFFYFAVVNNKMLVVSGNNYISNNENPTLSNASVFFKTDIQKFKCFLTTIELIFLQPVSLESFPNESILYRYSQTRKTIWEDADLDLKITAPEWEESRYTQGRDINGNFILTDWGNQSAYVEEYDGYPNIEKVVEVIKTRNNYQRLDILLPQFNSKNFSDIKNELLVSAGFCGSEWKHSKAECASSVYCYTRDEVLQNIEVKKQLKIGVLNAQLIGMNQEFSNKNDCRSEDVWLIKAKNGQFVLSMMSPDSDEVVRIEAN